MKKLLIASSVISFLFGSPVYAAALPGASSPCLNNLQKHVNSTGDTLTLKNCQITDSDVPTVVKFMNQHFALTSLDLTNNQISSVGAAELATNTKITSYVFDKNPLGDQGMIAITKNPNIRNFSAENCNIGDDGASALRTAGEAPINLDLSYNHIDSDGVKTLTMLSINSIKLGHNSPINPDVLKSINLSVVYIDVSYDNIGDAGLNALSIFPKLNAIDVSGDNISDQGIWDFTNSNKIIYSFYASNNKGITADGIHLLVNNEEELSSVDFANDNIGDEGANALSTLMMPGNIILDGNHITDKGLQGFSTEYMPIITLSLANNKITDAGAALLGKAANSLILDNNQVSDSGAKALSNSHLTRILSLNNNQVSDDGAVALGSDPYLDHLAINHNKVQDNGALGLAKSSALNWLDASDNSIGTTGVQALQEDKNLKYLNVKGNPGS